MRLPHIYNADYFVVYQKAHFLSRVQHAIWALAARCVKIPQSPVCIPRDDVSFWIKAVPSCVIQMEMCVNQRNVSGLYFLSKRLCTSEVFRIYDDGFLTVFRCQYNGIAATSEVDFHLVVNAHHFHVLSSPSNVPVPHESRSLFSMVTRWQKQTAWDDL
jgi:hypothetical protein